jgi:hypothetical protein
MSDVDQQAVVEAFGNEASPLRLLIASDVASEGINLHYLSHRMIHFDIPWSLLTFQQRNGRIDRYGQEKQPQLHYLLTESSHPKIRGDLRILEILIQKDAQVQENIGDPSEFTGLHTPEDEEVAIGAKPSKRARPRDIRPVVRRCSRPPTILSSLRCSANCPRPPATPRSLADHTSPNRLPFSRTTTFGPKPRWPSPSPVLAVLGSRSSG